jgi:hypothetical protein
MSIDEKNTIESKNQEENLWKWFNKKEGSYTQRLVKNWYQRGIAKIVIFGPPLVFVWCYWIFQLSLLISIIIAVLSFFIIFFIVYQICKYTANKERNN